MGALSIDLFQRGQMLLAPGLIGDFGLADRAAEIAGFLHRHRQEDRVLAIAHPVALLPAMALELHVGQQHEDIAQGDLVKQDQPRQIDRLVCAQGSQGPTLPVCGASLGLNLTIQAFC